MKIRHPRSVLHITPHLGGGVGAVLYNYLSSVAHISDFTFSLCCLEPSSQNQKSSFTPLVHQMEENCFTEITELLQKIAVSDIVVVHWWNHPLLFELLVIVNFPPCRLVFWSHVSGLGGTSIFTSKLLEYPDAFYLTTPVSKEAKVDKQAFSKLQTCNYIWSTSGLGDASLKSQKSSGNVNIGYIGTLDFAKIHSKFIRLSSQVCSKDIKFIVCGDVNNEMINDVSKQNLKSLFEFTGYVHNIRDYLNSFDIFGYPLSAKHYGTCDQVLGESMSFGVPPVVFNNPMESFIVVNGESGLVVESEREYVEALEFLIKEPVERKRLGDNARERALELYDTQKLISSWKAVYSDIMDIPKTKKQWPKAIDKIYSPT